MTTLTLASATPVVVSMVPQKFPVTVWLHSPATAGRKIEVSLDDGATWEDVVYELNALNANGTTYQKRVAFYSGVSRVRFTGASGDTYGVS